ncbi:MAG: hypothetical protein AAGJ73_04035 [Pseudomonadota bacterium]
MKNPFSNAPISQPSRRGAYRHVALRALSGEVFQKLDGGAGALGHVLDEGV